MTYTMCLYEKFIVTKIVYRYKIKSSLFKCPFTSFVWVTHCKYKRTIGVTIIRWCEEMQLTLYWVTLGYVSRKNSVLFIALHSEVREDPVEIALGDKLPKTSSFRVISRPFFLSIIIKYSEVH